MTPRPRRDREIQMSNSGALSAGEPYDLAPNTLPRWLRIVRMATIATLGGSLAVTGIAVTHQTAHHPVKIHKAADDPNIYFHADSNPALFYHA